MSHGETHGESKDERWWVKLRDAWTIRGTWVHLVDIVKRRIEDEMRTREAQPGIRGGRDCALRARVLPPHWHCESPTLK